MVNINSKVILVFNAKYLVKEFPRDSEEIFSFLRYELGTKAVQERKKWTLIRGLSPLTNCKKISRVKYIKLCWGNFFFFVDVDIELELCFLSFEGGVVGVLGHVSRQKTCFSIVFQKKLLFFAKIFRVSLG